jgi:hypothetical protein
MRIPFSGSYRTADWLSANRVRLILAAEIPECIAEVFARRQGDPVFRRASPFHFLSDHSCWCRSAKGKSVALLWSRACQQKRAQLPGLHRLRLGPPMSCSGSVAVEVRQDVVVWLRNPGKSPSHPMI